MRRSLTACVMPVVRSVPLWLALLAVLFFTGRLPSARADKTLAGDVAPSDLSTWNYNSTVGYIGNTASGTLTVDGGSDLSSEYGYIGNGNSSAGVVNVVGTGSTWNTQYLYVGNSGSGTLNVVSGGAVSSVTAYLGYCPGSVGTATVDGLGSTWTNSSLYLGGSGSGTLLIRNGGAVTVSYLAYVGYGGTSRGTIDFGPGGGTLTANTFYAARSSLTGSGVINTKGLVSDFDLKFDGTASYATSFDTAGTLTVDMSSANGYGDIGVGYAGSATLAVSNGAHIYSSAGNLGYYAAAVGKATVDGVGSAWHGSGSMYVGNSGSGALSISGNGTVSNDGDGYLGYSTGASGVVTVSGVGSIWTINDFLHFLHVGYNGAGTLSITQGGAVYGRGRVGYNPGSAGVVIVDGIGSRWSMQGPSTIGDHGSGTLSITGGGSVSGGLFVGMANNATGVVDVSGSGSTLTVYDLYVGQMGGSGTVSISDGGLARSKYCRISHGEVVVDGSGSSLIADVELSVGTGHGGGTLSIIRGGSVVSSGLHSYIGSGGSASQVSSFATVDGAGSVWSIRNALYVGNSGSGTLSITNGGSVQSNSGYVGYGALSAGKVSIDGSGSSWANSQTLQVGYDHGGGTLSITNGGSLSSGDSGIGNSASMPSLVVVDGAGSIWSNRANLNVGSGSSTGTLSISHGGSVSVGRSTLVAADAGSKGLIDFGVAGGTLTTQSLMASTTQLAGTGTVNARGLVSDIDLRFASPDDLKQAIVFHQSGQEVTVNLDLSTNPGSNGIWGAGWTGNGSLTIQGGASVTSASGYLGYNSNSTGTAVVSGAGSAWNTGSLYVGRSGSGILSIGDGGSVTSQGAYIRGPASVASIVGPGSSLTTGTLSVQGAIIVGRGGSVIASRVSINNTSLVAIDAGCGSLIQVGAGTLTNNGTIRILAGAGVPADATPYSPILAGTWAGTGKYQAVGGTWDTAGHTFTVSSVTAGTSGSPVALDLATVQRALIDGDRPNGTNWKLGASFPAEGMTSNMTFTATATGGALLDALKAVAGEHRDVLNAWTFSTTDYSLDANSPIYFSLKVGPGYSADDLDLWSYNGTSWAAYVPTDLTYDGTYASFTATGMSGYAATTAPEPGTLALLAAGFLGVMVYARRKRLRA
jgi:fibronectin-binding autotransporter adhesin